MGFERMYGGRRKDSAKRNENDYYPTPPFVTYALHYHENLPKYIWEPACGRGWMARELRRLDYRCFASDLHEYDVLTDYTPGIDFLDSYHDNYDSVVTNPPYTQNMAQKFIERTIFEKRFLYGAFLLRLNFAESETRLKLFQSSPPTRVRVFAHRFSCVENMFVDNPMGGMVSYAWWIWDWRYGKNDSTTMSWIDGKNCYSMWKEDVTAKPYPSWP